MAKNNGCTTGNLLDYEYFSINYKLNATNLSKHIVSEDTDTMQQISFIGRIGKMKKQQCFS